MIKSLFVAISLFLSVGCANAKEEISTGRKSIEDPAPGAPVAGETHRNRYSLSSAADKIVGNNGKGFEGLYGTRNMRAVLNGVYYRGGANNVYFVPKRSNANPLPTKGLENLCQEGFTQAVYLYSTNYSTAPKEVKCKTFEGNENTLVYSQFSPLAYRESDIRAMHMMMFDRVRDSKLGPVYDHCWNGWHASGYVAATALRQFCDFTAEEAVAYWNLNTDGNNGSSYNKVREKIRSFVPSPDMAISAEEKAALCPKPGSLEFSK